MKPSPIASSLPAVWSPTWKSRRWVPVWTPLDVPANLALAQHPHRAGHDLDRGRRRQAHARPGRATGIALSVSVITASSPTRSGRRWYQSDKLAQHKADRHRHDEHRHEREHEEPERAREDASLRHERHPCAVLEQLEGQQVGVDVVADALDRVLVRRVLEDDEQEHARHRRDDRGGEPARQHADGSQQECSRARWPRCSARRRCLRRTSIIRCIPGREAGPRPGSPLRPS